MQRNRGQNNGAAPAQHGSPPWAPAVSLSQMRANLAANGPQLYVGAGPRGLVWGGSQQAVLVLGPPRSGKTSSLVVPNVLAAPGPVVVTSTKLDVLQSTLASRCALGRCWVLDPTGTVQVPAGAHTIRWSPVEAASDWEEALVTARVMSQAARPDGHRGEAAHWTERAEALLAPLLHASALTGGGMRQVLSWVLCQDVQTPMAVLLGRSPNGRLAMEVLGGIAATEERERSGIFSTAAGTLAAYRSAAALAAADEPNFDPSTLPTTCDTVFVCAPARYQALVSPVVVAFLEQVRSGTYSRWASGSLRLPTTLVLDEVANIAPLPDLPSMVSEGGGQGLLTMACLQDLSQARTRWGQAADGFFSLFGTKVVLPGVGDMRTLEVVSRLAGQVDVPVGSVTANPWWTGRPGMSITRTWRRQARLPVDAAHSLPPGSALVVAAAQPPRLAHLTPWWSYPPFREATTTAAALRRSLPWAGGAGFPGPSGTGPPGRDRRGLGRPGQVQPTPGQAGPGQAAGRASRPLGLAEIPTGMPAPPSPPPGLRPQGPDLTVTWQRVRGARRRLPPPGA